MYGNLTDSLIRDRTVCGIPDNGLGERLLREDDFMLPEAVKVPFCRPTQSRAKDLVSQTLQSTEDGKLVCAIHAGAKDISGIK